MAVVLYFCQSCFTCLGNAIQMSQATEGAIKETQSVITRLVTDLLSEVVSLYMLTNSLN